jgi:hypothetical protein
MTYRRSPKSIALGAATGIGWAPVSPGYSAGPGNDHQLLMGWFRNRPDERKHNAIWGLVMQRRHFLAGVGALARALRRQAQNSHVLR